MPPCTLSFFFQKNKKRKRFLRVLSKTRIFYFIFTYFVNFKPSSNYDIFSIFSLIDFGFLEERKKHSPGRRENRLHLETIFPRKKNHHSQKPPQPSIIIVFDFLLIMSSPTL
uniref:Uncharacterized protein n=1 Tax=Brassica campestris TaxID=3711 RepID=A0A3P5ZSN4_BRACM|nr:unnamed protein product [Brassica rapa]